MTSLNSQLHSRRRSCRKRTAIAIGPVVDPTPKPKRSAVLGPVPKFVVGVDFGTTYSGFAYALSSNMKEVHCFYDWPDQASAGSKPYCKTETSLRYTAGDEEGEYHLQDWGWKATINHRIALQKSRSSGNRQPESYLVKGFKLHLAPSKNNRGVLSTSTRRIPVQLTGERTTADYLRMLSMFIMERLENSFGTNIMKKDVQWCLTVPALWDDAAKQQMIKCAEMAGMVQGPACKDSSGSPHQIIIVLEPEAASAYCQAKWKDVNFEKGSKFLVVDAGGGTVDLVVHEKVDSSGMLMKEAACSTGGLCGGTFVDSNFHAFVASKIGCYEKFQAEFPASFFRIQEFVEDVKCCYDGETTSYEYLDIPAKLASAWEAHDRATGTWHDTHDELVITGVDLKTIFDEVVDQILDLIRDQVRNIDDLQGIMVVGGFSNSPYLMRRIRDEFCPKIKHILNPPEPGSAVCRGAVVFGALDAEIMLSRKSKKTYGLKMSRIFRLGDPPEFLHQESGKSYCKNVFSIFVKKGEDVSINHQVIHEYEVPRGETSTELEIYATDKTDPAYVTESGVELVGSWSYRLPPQAQKMTAPLPSIEIGMFFGRTKIEIHVKPINFRGKKTSMTFNFERTYVDAHSVED